MRILLISDLLWSDRLPGLLRDRVETLAPQLVLIAGDLVNSHHPGAWRLLLDFLQWLDRSGLYCDYVTGNWDEGSRGYAAIRPAIQRLERVRDISGKVVESQGLKILGLPFSAMKNVKTARAIPQMFSDPVDLLLTHASFRPRIWLFHLRTRYIITGHFDSQLCEVDGKVFISFSTCPPDYALIDYGGREQTITYFGGRARGRSGADETVARVKDGRLEWLTEPLNASHGERRAPATGLKRFTDDYGVNIERLLRAKEAVEKQPDRREEIIEGLRKKGMQRRYILDYLAER